MINSSMFAEGSADRKVLSVAVVVRKCFLHLKCPVLTVAPDVKINLIPLRYLMKHELRDPDDL